MTLTKLWQDTIDQTPLPSKPALPAVPLLPRYYSDRLTYVDTIDAATAMLQLAQELPLSHIGIDTEFGYHRPSVELLNGKTADDPQSVKPLLLSVTLTAPQQAHIYESVIDLRAQQVLKATAKLLRSPVTFVGHFLQAEYICLRRAGLPIPATVWDTWVAEKAQHLGRHHVRYNLPADADDLAQTRAAEEAERGEQVRFDLVNTCRRHGVQQTFGAVDKERLQASFLNHAEGAAFSEEQLRYAASDATAAAKLYYPQALAATMTGTLNHLMSIEMPWIKVNAEMTWNGVRIDSNAQSQLSQACGRVLLAQKTKLAEAGLENHRSHPLLKAYFGRKSLLDAFHRGDGYSFGKDLLKEMRHLDPVIELIYETRKVEWLSNDAILNRALAGADGRVHPQHRHLGTASGRQSASSPNVLGLDRTLKPLIIPAEGYGIGEVDLSQIEIGVAAAVYGDSQLIEMYNEGDVYTAMARHFYAGRLSDDDLTMDGMAFKKAHRQLRDIMKTCTLGVIYGLTPHGLAPRLRVTVQDARKMLNEFMSMFPVLKQGLDDVWQRSARRGFAVTATGLRRYRAVDGPLTNWEKNWMRNHPVQGSAAAAFKLAGIRLSSLYPHLDTKLILAVHDAFVFEAPLDLMEEVGEVTRKAMCEAVQELFPVLRPRAEVNVRCPRSWNKDGQGDALREWLDRSALPA